MKEKPITCNKKKMSKKSAMQHLKGIIKMSGKMPWRDEISTYECEICGYYHLSSLVSENSPTKIKGKTYFEIQKEKWGNFLQNFSQNRGNITKRKKKYST